MKIFINSTYTSYPFGMVMPNRQSPVIAGDEHRYGFNGMEMDDEVKSLKGSSYDFGARMYDPRVGRWLTIDPLAGKYPSHTPYSFVANTPLIAIDPDGKDIIIVLGRTYDAGKQGYTYTMVKVTEEKIKNGTLGKAAEALFLTSNTESGKNLISEYINNESKDVYVGYGVFNSSTIEAQGVTINAELGSPINEEGIFETDRLPHGNDVDDQYFKELYEYAFEGLAVISPDKKNHFIVLNKEGDATHGDKGAELLFHELLHVLYLDRNVPAITHHDEMGSKGLNNGNNETKAIPIFRQQLKNYRESLIPKGDDVNTNSPGLFDTKNEDKGTDKPFFEVDDE